MNTFKEELGKIMGPMLAGQATPFSVLVTDHAQQLAGIKSKDLYWDADINAEISCLGAEYYGVMPNYAWDFYNMESEAIGQKIIFSDYGVTDNDQDNPLIKTEEDFDKIKWPDNDPLKCGKIPKYLKLLDLMEKYTGLPTTVYMGATTQFSMACAIMSFKKFTRIIRKDPKLAHDILLKITNDIHVPYFKAIAKKFPGVTIKIADAWEIVPNISPKIQKEFGYAYYDLLIEKTKDLNIKLEWYLAYGEHCAKDPKAYLKEKLKYNPSVFISGTETEYVPNSIYRELVFEENRRFMVNVLAKDIHYNDHQGIIEHIRDIVKDTHPGINNYLLLCSIAGNTPSKNVQVAVEACRAFTKLPIHEDFDKVEVNVEFKNETFETFVRNKAKDNPDGYTFKWLDSAQFKNNQ